MKDYSYISQLNPIQTIYYKGYGQFKGIFYHRDSILRDKT